VLVEVLVVLELVSVVLVVVAPSVVVDELDVDVELLDEVDVDVVASV
jgi:competence protein ComGC